MNLEELQAEHPELKTEINSLIESQATKIAEQASQGLLDKNNQLLDELKPLKQKMKVFEGIDPDEYKQLKEAAKSAERKGHLDKGEFDKVLEKMNSDFEAERSQWGEQHNKEISELQEKLSAKDKLAEKLFSQGVIAPLVGPHAINKRALQVLIDDIRQMVDVEEKDGDLIPKVKNGIKGDGTTKTIDELVGEVLQKPEYAPFVKGINATGSGATNSLPGGAGNKTIKRSDFDKLGDVQKGSFLKDGGKITD